MSNKVGYVLSQFPSYDETFIMREMSAVANNNIDITIFSLKQCRDKIRHDEALPLIEKTIYAPPLWHPEFWLSHLITFITQPFSYLWCMFYFLFMAISKPMVCLKYFAVFLLTIPLARKAKKSNINFFHGHWATYPTASAWMLARLTKGKFSFTGHAHDIYVDTTGLADKMNNAEFILTCTANNKVYLLEQCPEINPDKIVISYHGLDTTKYKPVEKNNDRFEIVSVGTLYECKGYPDLLTAGKILLEKGKQFRITIVGGGPEETNLKNIIKSLGLENHVEMTGYVTQDKMPEFYQRADVFALPVILEIHWGIPNVCVEAYACGIPVIISPLPSMVEIIDGNDTGFIIPEKSPDILADKLCWMIDNPDKLKEMGTLGRSKIEKMFDVKKNGRHVADMFRKHAV